MHKPKVFNRDPPGWQRDKLRLARRIVKELEIGNKQRAEEIRLLRKLAGEGTGKK